MTPEPEDNFDIEAFIKAIEDYKKQHSRSNSDLARLCNIDRAFFTKIRAGDKMPSLHTFNKIVAKLGLDANDFRR